MVLLAALLFGCGGRPAVPDDPEGEPPPPGLRVIDGDTFVVQTATGEEKVRLREVNAPESRECGGDAATELLRGLLSGGFELDRRGEDRYGRTLAHVHAPDGRHVQRELVAAGLAHVATYGSPDEHLDALLAAEAEARAAHRGLYGDALGCGAAASAADGGPSPATPVRTDVHVAEVDGDPDGDDMLPGAGESVLIRGPAGLSLAGWTLKDTSATHRLALDDTAVLSASGELRIFTSCGEPRPGVVHWCMRGSAVWNNKGGDTAFLLDPAGRVVSFRDFVPRR